MTKARSLMLPDRPLTPQPASSFVEPFANAPRVMITPEVYKRLQLFIQLSRAPINFLGTVKQQRSGNFLVDSVFLTNQDTSDGRVNVSLESQKELLGEIEAQPGGAEAVKRVRLWGSTYADQAAGAVHTAMMGLRDEGFDWAMRASLSANGRLRFDMYDFGAGYRILDAQWSVMDTTRGIVMNQHGVNFDLLNDSGTAGKYQWVDYSAVPNVLKPSAELRAEVKQEIETRVRLPDFSRFISPEMPMPHKAQAACQLLNTVPTIVLSVEAYQRMQLYIDNSPLEVGWMGTVRETSSGNYLIDNVFLIDQDVTEIETELSVDGQSALTVELMKRGAEGVELVNQLRFWGHSHVRFPVEPSSTDEVTMHRQFGEADIPYAVRGIFNKCGHARFCLYRYDRGYRIVDVPWVVMHPRRGVVIRSERGACKPEEFKASDALADEVKKELARKVRKQRR